MDGPTNRDRERRLNDADLEVLRSVGVHVEIDPADAEASRARHETEAAECFRQMRSAALSLEEFGAAAGIPVADVSRLVRGGSLWVLEGEAGPLVPSWALHEGRPLPGLGELARFIPRDMHPVVVDRWMHTENPDLVVDGSPVSVLEWLRAGRSPGAFATALGDWRGVT